MKKIILIFALIVVVLSAFVACSKGTKNKEATETSETTVTESKNSDVYENVAFDDLKTFTAVTGVSLNSTVEEKTYETTYDYVVLTDVDEKIVEYKEYLLEFGLKLTSSGDAETTTFELDDKELRIDIEENESDTRINITISCDEETNNTRKEKTYSEMVAAANEKDFDEVYDISDRFSSNEISEFKDVYAYRLFSLAMEAYDDKIYGEAREYFIKYCEEDTTDKLGGNAYLEECNNILSKYNGTYSGKSFNGYLSYFIYIKDGKVGMEFDNRELLGTEPSETIYYLEYLRIDEYKGQELVYIVDYTLGKITYNFKLTMLDSGEIIVNDNAWDVIKGYQNDTTTFAGTYKKTSSETPPEA